MIAQATAPLSQQSKKLNQHGEFELVAAVVEQARIDLELGKKMIPSSPERSQHRRNQADQARAWLCAAPRQPIQAWSFVWCCEVLGLCPLATRSRILANGAGEKINTAIRGRTRKPRERVSRHAN